MEGFSISESSTAAGKNPALILDSQWTARTAAALFLMKTTGQQFQSGPAPPPDFAALDQTLKHMGGEMVTVTDQTLKHMGGEMVTVTDQTLKHMGGEMVTVTDEYAQGVDQRSAAKLDSAAAHMQVITGDLNQGLQQLNDVKRKYGAS